MNLRTTLTLAPLLLAPLALGACNGESNDLVAEVKASAKEGMEKVKDIDLSDMNADAMSAKADELADRVAADLNKISDRASAENVRRELQPALDMLSRLKTSLGENLPDMSRVREIVDDLAARFADNEDVRKVLDPMLERLRSLTE